MHRLPLQTWSRAHGRLTRLSFPRTQKDHGDVIRGRNGRPGSRVGTACLPCMIPDPRMPHATPMGRHQATLNPSPRRPGKMRIDVARYMRCCQVMSLLFYLPEQMPRVTLQIFSATLHQVQGLRSIYCKSRQRISCLWSFHPFQYCTM
jgi:hypothetical protein